MKTVTATITIQNKKYSYELTPKKGDVIHVVCTAAHIDQDFLAADVAALIIDLPNLILAEKEYETTQSTVVRFRISPEDKLKIERKATKEGFSSTSDYLRHLALA